MKKSGLMNVKKSDFLEAYDDFIKYDGIITPKTSYYIVFLSKALGYIYSRCRNGEHADNVTVNLISQIAEAINSKGSVDYPQASEELERIKEALSQRDYQDISKERLISKLNIDFSSTAANFFLTTKIPRQVFVDYILIRENIPPMSEKMTVGKTIVHAFVDYLTKTNANINLNVGDLTDVLCEMVETEKSSAASQEGYINKYPCLTKAVLLQNTRREIAGLMSECSKEPVFSFYLGRLLSKLSSYDTTFLRSISVSVPYSKLSDKIREAFFSDFLLYKLAFALNPPISKSLPRAAITSDEFMIRTPGFLENMKECYKDNDGNDYADRVALAISKYCVGKNGGKFSAEQIKRVFDSRFGSSSKSH